MASSPTQEDWYWGRLVTGGEDIPLEVAQLDRFVVDEVQFTG